MHIALDAQSTVGRKTGIGVYTAELLAALQRVAPQHEVTALRWGRDVPMRLDRRLRWQQVEVPRRAKRASADLLHIPGFDAPLRKPCPVVLTVHDLIGSLYPRNLPPVSRFYWSRWLPFTIRSADAIIVDSTSTKDDLVRILGVRPEKITVVLLGVHERFRPQAEPARAALRERYQLRQPYLLYVGTLEPRKGIDTLIDSFAALAAQYPHDLVIAGKKGWYWDTILKRIGHHKLNNRVRVIDYVTDAELPALYSAASVFVFPSRYEGFGLPVLEAMACGTPVVCANCSSLPEVAGDGALLVPPDQPDALTAALKPILDGAGVAAQLRERGFMRAAELTWERTAYATLRVYAETLERRTNRT